VREAARVEALADRPRVPGLLPDDGRAERLEPGDRVVEPFDDEPLQRRIAAGTFLLEVVERAEAPDHAARDQHRAAGARALLQHDGLDAELAQPHGRHEPGHPRARDEHQVPLRGMPSGLSNIPRRSTYVSENDGLCSTYSTRTR